MINCLSYNEYIKMLPEGPFICFFCDLNRDEDKAYYERVSKIASSFCMIPCYRLSWDTFSLKLNLYKRQKKDMFYILNSKINNKINNPDDEDITKLFQNVFEIIFNKNKDNIIEEGESFSKDNINSKNITDSLGKSIYNHKIHIKKTIPKAKHIVLNSERKSNAETTIINTQKTFNMPKTIKKLPSTINRNFMKRKYLNFPEKKVNADKLLQIKQISKKSSIKSFTYFSSNK